MKKRAIGNQGLVTSAIGLGCMGMSEFYGEGDERESIRVVHEALDRGVTMLDTADMYGVGDNEQLLSRAIAGRRAEVIIATKFGIVRRKGEYARSINGRPEYVKKACDASLKRLGTDYIDLYYMHRKDPDVPIEETVGAMAELVSGGKVRFIGLSEVSGATLKRACAVHPVSALQTEYSLWTRDIEDGPLAACRELGVSLVAYSPLGRGFLTGAFKSVEDFAANDFRRISPRFAEENFYANLAMVEELKAYAARTGHTPAQLAIAWTLAKGDDIVPIPGTKKIRYLQDNIKAASISLTKAQIESLENIIDASKVKGLRYPEEGMKTINL